MPSLFVIFILMMLPALSLLAISVLVSLLEQSATKEKILPEGTSKVVFNCVSS